MRELPAVDALFVRFLYDSGDHAGARTRFQRLITDLIGTTVPLATEVSGPGGFDWGIDTYMGSLEGLIAAWQSKFFPKWEGETQRGQVRKSFKELMDKAREKGFKVERWTLCIPCILPPDEQKWLDTWRRKQERDHGITTEVWNGVAIRRRLQLPDSIAVRQLYFSDVDGPIEKEVAELADPSLLSGTLFVHQLESAGLVENDAAKGFYFAAEALARDLEARGTEDEINGLREIALESHGAWEHHFNAAAPTADASGRMSGLVGRVTDAVGQLPNPSGLALRPAHKKGFMHRLVELARAGWVLDWRARAESHSGPAGTDVVAASASEGYGK
jgi:hypothetical protein